MGRFYPGLSGQAQGNHKGLYKKEEKGSESEKMQAQKQKSERREDNVLLALKTEEGVTSPGSCKR